MKKTGSKLLSNLLTVINICTNERFSRTLALYLFDDRERESPSMITSSSPTS